MTRPDINDTLRDNGEDAVRERQARAKPFDPNEDDNQSKPNGAGSPKQEHTDEAEEPDTRPVIWLIKGQQPCAVDEATALLRDSGEIFERGGELVHVVGQKVEACNDDWLIWSPNWLPSARPTNHSQNDGSATPLEGQQGLLLVKR
jgi:hypothetical protein